MLGLWWLVVGKGCEELVAGKGLHEGSSGKVMVDETSLGPADELLL